jgi:hypothetical protein
VLFQDETYLVLELALSSETYAFVLVGPTTSSCAMLKTNRDSETGEERLVKVVGAARFSGLPALILLDRRIRSAGDSIRVVANHASLV